MNRAGRELHVNDDCHTLSPQSLQGLCSHFTHLLSPGEAFPACRSVAFTIYLEGQGIKWTASVLGLVLVRFCYVKQHPLIKAILFRSGLHVLPGLGLGWLR